MQQTEQPTSRGGWSVHLDSMFDLVRALQSRVKTSLRYLKGHRRESAHQPPIASPLKIARYSLVLMDADGQVVWTGEWDSGGVFEFRPRQRLCVFCGFTNYSGHKTEVAEYEIELMSEDGSIVERFNDSFGDSLIISPGESRQFPGEWRM